MMRWLPPEQAHLLIDLTTPSFAMAFDEIAVPNSLTEIPFNALLALGHTFASMALHLPSLNSRTTEPGR
jgi:hypothetical protein